MIVAACKLDLKLTGNPRSLKEKRMVIQSLKEKIRKRFEVSVAEVDGLDLWQRCILGIACVCREYKEAEQTFQKLLRFVEEHEALEMLDSEIFYYS